MAVILQIWVQSPVTRTIRHPNLNSVDNCVSRTPSSLAMSGLRLAVLSLRLYVDAIAEMTETQLKDKEDHACKSRVPQLSDIAMYCSYWV